jgi:DNA polymerase-3 subunit delta'
MLLLKVGFPEAISNVDIRDTLTEWSDGSSMNSIRDSIRAVGDAEEQLNLNASPRLALEVMMLDVPVRTGYPVKR